MSDASLFAALEVLKQRVAPNNQLEVMHGGYVWTAGFEWYKSATESDASELENELGLVLPKDYRAFLLMCDGAVLYKDLRYGQWGFHLYSSLELPVKNHEWKQSLRGKWSDNLIAFAENQGESNVLVFDTNRPTSDGLGYAVVEANPYDPPQDWTCASRSFHEWLEHLITAQGDKYWEWH